MLDHVTLKVTNLETSIAFYDAALAPLGIERLYHVEGQFAGYGVAPKAFFWIGGGANAITGSHIAFTAPSRAAVEMFYVAAKAAGGIDNGVPGPRPHYHEHYYGAFVLDPDGHNIEAVCHKPDNVSS
jgi:catechol 2,3-dioxygenase-like lactoylglutathione lyase family enzyme